MIERQRPHEDAYRWGKGAALMQDHSDAILQYYLSWLEGGLAEEGMPASRSDGG
jgi:hypothetical protein